MWFDKTLCVRALSKQQSSISCEHQGVSIWSLTLPVSNTVQGDYKHQHRYSRGFSLSALPGRNFSFPESPSGLGEPVLDGCSLGPWRTNGK